MTKEQYILIESELGRKLVQSNNNIEAANRRLSDALDDVRRSEEELKSSLNAKAAIVAALDVLKAHVS